MKFKENKLLSGSQSISFFTFLLYSLPSIPITSAQMIVYIIIPPIYSLLPNVGIAITGLAIMLSRFVDMISDPIMGTYLDSLVSKLGWKIWLIFGFPLISIGIYILLNPIYKFEALSLFLGLIAVTLGWTFFSIPWWSIGIAISEDSSQNRFKIVSFRELLTIPGIILGLIIAYYSDSSGEIYLIISLFLLSPLLIKKIPIPKVSFQEKNSYFYNIQLFFKYNKNFRNLCLAYFFIGLSNGITSILFILFVQYIIGGSPFYFLIIYFVSAFIGLPFIYLLGTKYKKNKVWIVFIILACISFIPVYFLENGDTLKFLIVCIISGLCLSADLILPASIQANIINQVQKKDNKVLVGKIYSVWSLIQKLTLALSAGVWLPLLGYFGFNPSEVNPTLGPLSVCYGITPIILRLPAVVFASYIKKN
jgi:Na+/melibiose symporter-like transporter